MAPVVLLLMLASFNERTGRNLRATNEGKFIEQVSKRVVP